MARANECPRCGAYVSQFAAGCAVCGADLEHPRRRRSRRLVAQIAIPQVGEAAALTVLMIVVALFAPLFGMPLAALVFFDRWRRGDRTMGYIALGAFALSLIGFAA
jgi:uncharacterized iron-regulated membrane protein